MLFRSHTQVIKQADVIQLLMDHPERYDHDVQLANLEHYLPRTQHGSSLSRPAHALVAARLGRTQLAAELFLRGALVDLLADAKQVSGGTFIGGIHTASAGGAWQVAVLGFGGVLVKDDHVRILPRLPQGWDGLAFRIRVRRCALDVEVRPARTTVHAHADNPAPVQLRLADGLRTLAPGATTWSA